MESVAQIVQLFCNPRAGSHSARRLHALISALEAEGAKVIQCESSSGIPRIDPRATHVCVAAGDGTVRHVAGAVARSGRQIVLGIFPSGTVNLLAMEAGYPRDPSEFARMLLHDEPSRPHYPVAMDDGYFFACAGAGPDSLAVDSVSPALKRVFGRVAYAFAALRLLGAWPRRAISLKHPGGTVQCEAFYVAKGRYYGGRWSLVSDARANSPMLHVVALLTARRRDYMRFIWTMARHGDVSTLPFVRVFSCTTLRADAAGPLPLQADGDSVGHLPVTLTLCEKPLVFC